MRFGLLVLVATLMLTYPMAGFAQSVGAPSGAKTIEVTGHGDASAKPDTMSVSFGVNSEAKNADECTRMEAAKVNKVVDAIKSKLGSQAKIQTSDFSLNQQFGYAGPTPSAAIPPATWTFRGQVNVRYPTLEDLGDFISAGLAAGATGVAQSGFDEVGLGQENQNSIHVGSSVVGTVTSGAELPGPTRRVAFVWLTIQADGSSADDAMRRGAALGHRVEAAVRAKMNGQGSVEISEFQIQQDVASNGTVPVYRPPSQQVIGYSSRTTVTVETHDLDALGGIIENAMNAGAAQLNQVTFTLGEDSQARKLAIEKAADDAKTKAATVASSMGVKLGSVLRISTNGQPRPQTIYGNALQGQGFSSAAVGTRRMSVLPREVGFSAEVSAVYQIE